MKTTIQIKSIFGKLLFEYEKEENTIKETLLAAVAAEADLYGADLYGADLRGADLSPISKIAVEWIDEFSGKLRGGKK